MIEKKSNIKYSHPLSKFSLFYLNDYFVNRIETKYGNLQCHLPAFEHPTESAKGEINHCHTISRLLKICVLLNGSRCKCKVYTFADYS